MKDDERRLLIELNRSARLPREIAREQGMHPKRACAMLAKWAKRGWYDYGVSVDMGWLEQAGKDAAKAMEPQTTKPKD